MKNGKNVTMYLDLDLANDEALRKIVYSVYGRSGYSGLLKEALLRLKAKGKL